mgnify:CR=1 FL=1
MAKVYERIIDKRLIKVIESNLEEAQCGFRKGRSAQDHIFTIKQLIEKSKEKSSEIYMAFLDPTKAFDSVPRRIIIWQSSERRKVTGKLIQVIKSLYSKTWNYVRTENKQ